MIKFGKTIKLFLMDADPEGRMVCELSNWTGKAYRIPRGRVKDCADREELRSTAVYLLFGKADSSASRPKVYIGEAENVYNRLVQHVAEKEYWNESVVFISKDENLNKAHIKYLESRLHEIALQADRYDLENGNTPTRSSISEADQAEMEEFIQYVKMLVNTMGFKVFEPIVRQDDTSGNDITLYVSNSRGANARGKRVSDGFVVYMGSEIAQNPVASFTKGFSTLRDDLLAKKIVVEQGDTLVLQEDYLFSSPSAAAAVVLGRSANGLVEWKDSSGIDLKTIETAEIRDAETELSQKNESC
ncbi:GIY-YIG nuclease family protein [Chitinivibrio alkaliphilus]|uniref:Methionine sulfoxide reductase A n=1 Tax=Chitinivibrio alkaliphilus ACht1 TaxID=1313304 RepID=U7DB16_9BACT|nr:GIY-YIG nuclease family protein [Chitinivibrio alkaliphilus]ERP39222.1 methionine sulfoxide reductase A [Chitinivibrio alkaliphilus ACht1]